jgi:hypothetical protein
MNPYQDIVPNAEQADAIINIAAWSNSEELFYVLRGAAGTGKTTTVKQIIKSVKQLNNLCISAPTHKAKAVLGHATGLQALTIQALLGLRKDVNVEDFDPRNPQFRQIASPKIDEYRLVIIDETSMINKDLLDLIIREATGAKTKILFVGDDYQLPPISKNPKEEVAYSPVFDLENTSRLIEVVRQGVDNPSMLLLLAIRLKIAMLFRDSAAVQQIRTDFGEIAPKYLTDFDYTGDTYFEQLLAIGSISVGNKGYEIVDKEDRETVAKLLEAQFLTDENSRILAYTNDRVGHYNEYLRKYKFPNSNEAIEIGDVLMSYTTLSEGRLPLIINSADYMVVTKGEVIHDSIHCYKVQMQDITTMQYTPHLLIVHEDNYDTFLMVHEKFHREARFNGQKWKPFMEWRNRYLTLVDFKKKYPNGVTLSNGDFVEARNLPKKDLDYAFSITTHKSQGSTFNDVFVDVTDIRKVLSYDPRSFLANLLYWKLLYVATSRAKDKIYLLM